MFTPDRRRAEFPSDILSRRLLYFNTFCNLVSSMVSVEGEDVEGTPPAFIIGAGLKHGRAAFIEPNRPGAGWYACDDGGGDLTRYGYLRRLWLTQANDERGFYRTDKTAKEIRFSPSALPLTAYFLTWAGVLDAFDRAMNANVNAARYGRMIGVGNNERNSVKIALQQAGEGDPAIVTQSILSAIQNSDISVPFTTPAILAAKNAYWADCIKQIGGITSQQQAQERTQTAQVNAAIGESVDFIYIMISQFNADCKYHGVKAKMIYTGFAARFDEKLETLPVKDPDGVQTPNAEKEDANNGATA